MSDQALTPDSRETVSPIKQAVYRSRATSRQGVLERIFAAVFDNLVYSQIWEDPVVDMRALEIGPSDHVVTIASGGCNVLSYLTANPARITAVDLNPAHLALTRLKLAAAQHLPAHCDFHRFFGEADSVVNEHLYELFLEPHLDAETREYWSRRDLFRSRRIGLFSRNIYRYGMLGHFIFAAHRVARLYGVDPAGVMAARSLDEQRAFFEKHLSPLFDKKLVRWMTSLPVSLYGLGIPPAQYAELAEGRHMADVLRERLEALVCDHGLRENYFARQAFGRSYHSRYPDAVVPPYLARANWSAVRERAERVATVNASVTQALTDTPARTVSRVVLLDAQDWMNDGQMNALWRAIGRATRPGARVIFRTAARSSPLEARIDPLVLSPWRYDETVSRAFCAQDRSAIYGGFHLYVRSE